MATERKRPLSEGQARSCEEAVGHVCKCRCGGAFHGSARGGSQAAGRALEDVPRSFFEELGDDDPHHIPSVDEVRAARRDYQRAYRERQKRKLRPLLPGFDRESEAAS